MPPSSRICSSNTPRSYSSVTLWPLSNARAVSPHGPLPRTSECRRCRSPRERQATTNIRKTFTMRSKSMNMNNDAVGNLVHEQKLGELWRERARKASNHEHNESVHNEVHEHELRGLPRQLARTPCGCRRVVSSCGCCRGPCHAAALARSALEVTNLVPMIGCGCSRGRCHAVALARSVLDVTNLVPRIGCGRCRGRCHAAALARSSARGDQSRSNDWLWLQP